jgi:hypothetical protein
VSKIFLSIKEEADFWDVGYSSKLLPQESWNFSRSRLLWEMNPEGMVQPNSSNKSLLWWTLARKALGPWATTDLKPRPPKEVEREAWVREWVGTVLERSFSRHLLMERSKSVAA